MNHLGYYGKVAHRGDFVRFNLPGTLIDVWDDWLQGVLIAGEQRHSGEWADHYASASAWRFVLSRGVAGAEGWFGVMLPSSDKVGRRFPFMLAAELPADLHPAGSMHALDVRFDELEKLAANAMSASDAFDGLQDRLREMPLAGAETEPTGSRIAPRDPVDQDDVHVGLWADSARALAGHAGTAAVLDGLLVQTFGAYSVWCSSALRVDAAASAKAEATLVVRGLPIGRTGIALFTDDRDADGCGLVGLADRSGAGAPRSTSAVAPLDAVESPPKAAPSSATTPTEEDDMLSTGDWSALEMMPDSAAEEHAIDATRATAPAPVPVPEKEPLEFEEDAGQEAPWER